MQLNNVVVEWEYKIDYTIDNFIGLIRFNLNLIYLVVVSKAPVP
jgi:hypothetical protein